MASYKFGLVVHLPQHVDGADVLQLINAWKEGKKLTVSIDVGGVGGHETVTIKGNRLLALEDALNELAALLPDECPFNFVLNPR